jgi:hypothetical protein
MKCIVAVHSVDFRTVEEMDDQALPQINDWDQSLILVRNTGAKSAMAPAAELRLSSAELSGNVLHRQRKHPCISSRRAPLVMQSTRRGAPARATRQLTFTQGCSVINIVM